jgi:hypothetical protein
VLRHLTVQKDKAVTTPSVMMKAVEREEARKAQPGASRCLIDPQPAPGRVCPD